MAVGSPEPVILKPRTDKREYRRIVLPNSLEALSSAAAAMNVSVGYFSDPEGLEGLAHFLEHMLFYAIEKYPVEDSYSNFITEHGGSKNASTTSERTNFFFDINADYLDEALDRFKSISVQRITHIINSVQGIGILWKLYQRLKDWIPGSS